jgi:hypothetical protein
MAETKPTLTAAQARTLKSLAAKYNAATAKADELRAKLDDVVFETRNSPGGTFRAIAELADRSVAWVQGSLERSEKRK